MRKRILEIVFLASCLAPMHPAQGATDPNDYEGSKDAGLFSRMPGFHISNYQELDFDRYVHSQ